MLIIYGIIVYYVQYCTDANVTMSRNTSRIMINNDSNKNSDGATISCRNGYTYNVYHTNSHDGCH